MSNTYICDNCHRELEKGWSDEEAQSEYLQVFGREPVIGESEDEDDAVVCDDCYKQIMAWWSNESAE